MADVYLSYRREDFAIVEKIAAALELEGLDVWLDQEIPTSSNWRVEISRELEKARCVLVVWSQHSVDPQLGRWVIQEAETAIRNDTLVPIRIDDTQPPIELRHIQVSDLFDWTGDLNYDRWQEVVSVVKSKVSERKNLSSKAAVDHSFDHYLKGRLRISLFLLALGLAALIITSATAVSPAFSAVLVSTVTVFYGALNILMGRCSDDRTASSLLQRLFSVSWVTYTANVFIWLTTLAFAVKALGYLNLYEDLEIRVVDELRQPVSEAHVTIEFKGKIRRVKLDEKGIGNWRIPTFERPETAVIQVQHLGSVATKTLRNTDRRFAHVLIPIQSGNEKFRVAHYTASEIAIDAIYKGKFPVEINRRFPNIVAVLRNPVWEETGQLLRAFDQLGNWKLNADYFGENIDSKSQDYDDISIPQRQQAYSLRWARGIEMSTPEYSNLDTLIKDSQNSKVSENLFAVVFSADDFVYGRPATLDQKTWQTLFRGSAPATNEEGKISMGLIYIQNGSQLNSFLNRFRYFDQYSNASERLGYLKYLVDRNPPAEFFTTTVVIRDEGGCSDTKAGYFLQLLLPDPELRITIIENISSSNIPISSIIYHLVHRSGISSKDAELQVSKHVVKDPLPGGVLRPGDAIVVPRKLILRSWQSAQTTNLLRNLIGSSSDTGEIANIKFDPPFNVDQNHLPISLTSSIDTRIRLPVSHILPLGTSVVLYNDQELDRDRRAVFIAGPSIKRIDLVVNSVEIPTREDQGIPLAMVGGQAWGSCPYVFVRHVDKNYFLNMGQVITDRIGVELEGTDKISIGRQVKSIELRELEPEISYINYAELLVKRASGKEQTFIANNPKLEEADDRYVVLHQGDVLRLLFSNYSPLEDDVSVSLLLTGYYTPLSERTLKR